MTKEKQLIKKRVRTPDFKKFYATNINCGVTNQDIRIEVMNEKLIDGDGEFELIEALIIFSPIGAKKLLNELSKVIKVYERENGVIKIT